MRRLKGHLFEMCVFGMLLLNKGLIRLLPFKKLTRVYANAFEQMPMAAFEDPRVPIIRRTVTRVSQRSRFGFKCFEQALTVLMLSRIFRLPCVVFFGIRKDEGNQMLAHAWSEIGGQVVSGYETHLLFTVVYKMAYDVKVRQS